MGRSSLAYYDKAYTLSRYPVSYLSNIITPVIHPILAEHQNDNDYIYNRYMEVVKAISAIGILASGFFIAGAKEIVMILFGSQWNASILPFQIISYSLWVQMLTGTVGAVMQSLGNTKGLFKMCGMTVLFSCIGIGIGVYSKKLPVLAWMIDIVYYIHFVIYYYVTLKDGFKKPVFTIYQDLKNEIISVVLMQIIAFLIDKYLIIENIYISFGIKCLFVFIFFFILIQSLLKNNTAVKCVKVRFFGRMRR
jgi:PST family polysaccharide transporter